MPTWIIDGPGRDDSNVACATSDNIRLLAEVDVAGDQPSSPSMDSIKIECPERTTWPESCALAGPLAATNITTHVHRATLTMR
ncbi:MAG: hypothetical protein KF774_07510 [Planctomyces sp.]|nr:hypothetical protein [Planctomyces sp.]